MSDIRDPIQSVLDPNSEGFRVFDEFVIDSSVELIVNHRDIFLTRGSLKKLTKYCGIEAVRQDLASSHFGSD